MTSLEVVSGGGRLHRTSTFIAFSVAPLPGIADVVEADHGAFKSLAGLVVAGDFDVAPFVVLDLRDRRVFLFGDLSLQLATGEVLNGASSSTWVERVLTEHELIGLSTPGLPRSTDSAELTDLQIGCVPAGGFRFGTSAQGGEVESSVESLDPPTPPEALRSIAGAPDAAAVNRGQSEPAPPSASALPGPPGSAEGERNVESTPEDRESDNEGDVLPLDPSWDPLAEPESIDLSAIGQPVLIADEPTPKADLPEVSDLRRESSTSEQSEPESSVGPDETIFEHGNDRWTPPAAPTSTDLGPPSNAPAPIRPRSSVEAVSSPPPLPLTPSADGMIELELDGAAPPPPNAPGSSPTVGSRVGGAHGSLLFDDGQRVPVDEGVYVGRFPTKHGVPDGYEAVVVRSEEVSRLHWELVVEEGNVFVQDLGSQNGTTLEGPGGQTGGLLSPNELSEIRAGTTISFGDRWARFEV